MTGTAILGWVLIHFLWQGMAVACLLALALTLAGRRSPSVRYLLAVTALLIMAAMPVATAIRLAAGDAGAMPAVAGPHRAGSSPDGKDTTAAGDPSAGAAESTLARSATSLWLPGASPAETLRRSIDLAMPWVVGAWLACVLALSMRLVSGWLWTRHLRITSVRPVSPQILAMVDRMARRLRVSRPVRVLESALVQVPAVIGSLRPIILIPVSLPAGLTPLQLEALLIHELAHVRRHDYTVNLLQSVLETLLFYHPAVWWVSGRIREEREQCCDDLAVALCGDARLYAGALFELERARAQAPALATAATGDGALTRRIRRLVSPLPSHAEAGHRWVAGALVAVVLLVGLGGNVPFSGTSPVQAAGKTEAEKKIRIWPGTPTRGSAPARVILYQGAGSASLEERWRWAAETAQSERLKSYWIGYAVKGRQDGYWTYFDRHVPVSTDDGSIFTGHMRTNGTLDGFRFTGVPLDGLVGSTEPRDLAIFYGFRAGEPERLHASSFAIPVHFDDRALIWLGEGDDAGSIELARSLFDRAHDTDLKKDLIRLVGTHADGRAATPVLAGWLRGEEPDEIRAEAAESLGEQDDPAALSALVSAAKDDRSREVRKEAAEAVGESRAAGALEAHLTLARGLRDPEARREAVESLAQRDEKEALDEIARIAREDADHDVRREAVETLGEFEGRRGLPHLMEIARSHADSDIRREAVQTLAEAAAPEEALATLQSIAREDPDSDLRREAVESIAEIHISHEKLLDALAEIAYESPDIDAQREAVETLAEIHDERTVKVLVEMAERHPRLEIQKQAIQSLGEMEPTAPAKEALIRFAKKHPREEVQREAVEVLGQFEGDDVAETLDEIADRHPNVLVQQNAIESLAEQHHDPATLERLADTARSHSRLEVRKQAIESYAEYAPPAAAASLLAELARDDASYEIRRTAVEMLADLPDSAGIEPLLAIARKHPEREIRRKAIEALAESNDPRAIKMIEEILLKP